MTVPLVEMNRSLPFHEVINYSSIIFHFLKSLSRDLFRDSL